MNNSLFNIKKTSLFVGSVTFLSVLSPVVYSQTPVLTHSNTAGAVMQEQKSLANVKAFKSEFLVNTENSFKGSAWQDSNIKSESKRIKRVDDLMKRASKAGLLTSGVVDKVTGMTPKASKMAVYNDVSKVLDGEGDITKEQLEASFGLAVKVHNTTRDFISVFYARDDSNKKDTWSTYSEDLNDKVIETFNKVVDLKGVVNNSEVPQSLKDTYGEIFNSFKEKYIDKIKNDGILSSVLKESFELNKNEKAKTSTRIMDIIKGVYLNKSNELEAVRISEDKIPVKIGGEDFNVNIKAHIPTATLNNKLSVKAKPVDIKNSKALEVIKNKSGEEILISLDIKIEDHNKNSVEDFNGGLVSISIDIPESIYKLAKEGKLKIYHIEGNGKVSLVDFELGEDNSLTFKTDSFSEFALVKSENEKESAKEYPDKNMTPLDNMNTKSDTKKDMNLADTGMNGVVILVSSLAIVGAGVTLLRYKK